ncbi:MAG: shikimate dehydrogenase, partial [Actinomycetota bacterium]|nr:shikimate dehydrogenase [Actinomycetota bacterium]
MASRTAATRLVCLLGHPVGHSVSPQIHAAAFADAGIDAVYLACDVAEDRLATAVTGLRALGALGANVTVPHKRTVVDLVDELTPEAQAVGAVNTLWFRDGRLMGDNTDTSGLGDVLDTIGLRSGDPVLLFGAGGAARAAAVAFGRRRANVEVVARRREAAAEVAALATVAGATLIGPDAAGRPRFVVNATPLGLGGEPLPRRFMDLAADQVALDLVYAATATPFVAAARAAGARALDGRGMLVAQAARSFQR